MRASSRTTAILSTLSFAVLGCGDDHAAGPALITEPHVTTDANAPAPDALDEVLRAQLAAHGFTGQVETSLPARLGRPIDAELADIGRNLWFDPILGLKGDNSCSGCHSPTAGFGDTQSIAIGIDNNSVVGPGRTGPRNQRRSPMVLNAAFFPRLMWNSRFAALSDDPFDNSAGYQFPAPEGTSLSYVPHLLQAQAFIPPTERVEMAGFDFAGNNDDLRTEVVSRVSAVQEYVSRFANAAPTVPSGPLTYDHIAAAIAEFTFSLTFANAPIDRFARGETGAMSESQKRGAVLFFGRAGCVQCHAVGGRSNEMFSDFEEHVIGVPQVAPSVGNVVFDGPGANEDFGLEQITGKSRDRYAFRTTPLRNVGLQPTYMHNGAFVTLEDAIRHHLDPRASALGYTGSGLAADLTTSRGPIVPVLDRLDSKLRNRIALNEVEFANLVDFVRNGLLDPRARPEQLRALVPATLPSGKAVHTFEFD